MKDQYIYLDNAATTKLDDEVLTYMNELSKSTYGNPSSMHKYGRKSRALIENTRINIGKYLGVKPYKIIFTSGGSEANNMVLRCCVRDLGIKRIITSPLEHHAVLHTLEDIKSCNELKIDFVKYEKDNELFISNLDRMLKESDEPTLVSLMYVNNEIGDILPIHQISKTCKENKAYFHSDCVQSLGYEDLNFDETHVDFISASAHKMHGPKGVGFTILNSESKIRSLICGGGQEYGHRAGTENPVGIAGFGLAFSRLMENRDKLHESMRELKSYFIDKLKTTFEGVQFNGKSGDLDNSSNKIISARFPFCLDSSTALLLLDMKGLAVSLGSACQSGTSHKGTHVLRGILTSEQLEESTIRLSISKYTTKDEIDRAIVIMKEVFEEQLSIV